MAASLLIHHLPDDFTEDELSALLVCCGAVTRLDASANVEDPWPFRPAPGRGAARSRLARVTVASTAQAQAIVATLHGQLFRGRTLRVHLAPATMSSRAARS